MKEARYLFRLAHPGNYRPADQARLLAQVRELAIPYKGKAINLRVSPLAIEFDLFCSDEADLRLFQAAFKPLGNTVTCKRLDVPPVPMAAQQVVDEARRLFNERRFWEVHEALEGLWKELQGTEKQLVQGLILAAAALVHAQKDEDAVTWTMLSHALTRLEHQPDDYYGWNIRHFQAHFTRVLAAKTLDFPTV